MGTFVIAEAGSCHDGIYEKAVGLIDVAKDAGANACKFQFWSNVSRLAERRQAASYIPIYAQYQMPREWLGKLSIECDRRGLEFMCTTYLPEDIEVVEPYVRRFKVASFEAADRAFLAAHHRFGKPVIVSTGMMSSETDTMPFEHLALHCVSAYPTPLGEANLGVLRDGAYAGFSDHTHCLYAGAFAVCAGAKIIETHIKDWTTEIVNPDAETALDPGQFTEYVRLIRLAEKMLGTGEKRPMPCEAAMTKYRVAPAGVA